MSVTRTLGGGLFTSISVANAAGTGGVDFTLTAVLRSTGVSHTLTIGSGSTAYTTFEGATPTGVFFRLLSRVPTATATPLTEVVVSASDEIESDNAVFLKLLRPSGFVWQQAPVEDSPDIRGLNLLVVVDAKSSGTNGGTFTSGAWRTRTLNTVIQGGFGSLSSNQITLPAGTYRVTASAPATQVDEHQTRLQNITAGTTIQLGSSERCPTTGFGGLQVNTRSFLEAFFTLDVESDLEVQHRCNLTEANVGFGTAVSFSTGEVYTQVCVERISS